MRKTVLAVLLVTSGLAGGAQAQTAGQSYAQAQAVFGNTLDGTLAGIDGEWLPMSLLAGGLDAEIDDGMIATFTTRFCGTAQGGWTIESRSAGFTLTQARSGGDVLPAWYDWLGGERFRYNVDPEAYARHVGLAEGTAQADDRRAQAWSQLPATAAVYRVGEDVLVIAPDRGASTILVRCP